MELVAHGEVSAFLAAVEGALEEDEAANSLLLGVALSVNRGVLDVSDPPVMLALLERGQVCCAAFMVPPNPLIIAGVEGFVTGGLELVADWLQGEGRPVTGVVARPEPAAAFSEVWIRRTRQGSRVFMQQRVYALRSVKEVPVPEGVLRVAGPNDIPRVTDWMRAFDAEALHNISGARAEERARRRIGNREIFLWEEGGLRSMVGRARPTRHTVAVNAVYTPESYRRRGYATAAVRLLSALLLDEGFSECVLYTDLMNPTSNSIYQRIGYEPVCDSVHLVFA